MKQGWKSQQQLLQQHQRLQQWQQRQQHGLSLQEEGATEGVESDNPYQNYMDLLLSLS